MSLGAHRAAVLFRPGHLDLVERETPEPSEGQIVVARALDAVYGRSG